MCPNFTDYYYKLTGVSRSESAKVGNNNSGAFYAIVLYEFDNRRPTLGEIPMKTCYEMEIFEQLQIPFTPQPDQLGI